MKLLATLALLSAILAPEAANAAPAASSASSTSTLISSSSSRPAATPTQAALPASVQKALERLRQCPKINGKNQSPCPLGYECLVRASKNMVSTGCKPISSCTTPQCSAAITVANRKSPSKQCAGSTFMDGNVCRFSSLGKCVPVYVACPTATTTTSARFTVSAPRATGTSGSRRKRDVADALPTDVPLLTDVPVPTDESALGSAASLDPALLTDVVSIDLPTAVPIAEPTDADVATADPLATDWVDPVLAGTDGGSVQVIGGEFGPLIGDLPIPGDDTLALSTFLDSGLMPTEIPGFAIPGIGNSADGGAAAEAPEVTGTARDTDVPSDATETAAAVNAPAEEGDDDADTTSEEPSETIAVVAEEPDNFATFTPEATSTTDAGSVAEIEFEDDEDNEVSQSWTWASTDAAEATATATATDDDLLGPEATGAAAESAPHRHHFVCERPACNPLRCVDAAESVITLECAEPVTRHEKCLRAAACEVQAVSGQCGFSLTDAYYACMMQSVLTAHPAEPTGPAAAKPAESTKSRRPPRPTGTKTRATSAAPSASTTQARD